MKQKALRGVGLILTHLSCVALGFLTYEGLVAGKLRVSFNEQSSQIRDEVLSDVSEHMNAVDEELDAFKARLAATHKEMLVSVADELDAVRKDWGDLARRMAEGKAVSAGQAEASWEKGQELWDDGEFDAASCCFYNAIGQDPTNLSRIEGYCALVISWCRQQIESGDTAVAWDSLRQLDAFLRSRLPSIPPTGMQRWLKLRETLDSLRQGILTTQAQERAQTLAAELRTAAEACGAPLPESTRDAEAQLAALEEHKSILADYDEVEHLGLAGTRQVLDDRLPKLRQQLAQLVLEEQFDESLRAAREEWEAVLTAGPQDAAAADAVLYRLRMLDHLTSSMMLYGAGQRVVSRIRELAAFSEEVASYQENRGLANLEEKILAVQRIEPGRLTLVEPSAQEASSLMDELQKKLLSPDSAVDREKVQVWMREVSSKLGDLRVEQHKRYQKWAVQQCKDLFPRMVEDYKWKNDIAAAERHLMEYLSPINTAFLSPAASTCYQEVFQYTMEGLSREQRIRVSAEMALGDKRSLSYF